MKTENTYRNILKGISIFGGVQVFNIFVSLLRGKFVAMFLGPVGMGISSLYMSSAQTVQRIASLGLGMAVAKDIASASEQEEHMRGLMAVVRRLMLLTSLAGAAICIILAHWLGYITFGNYDYTWGFVLLGAFVALSIAGDVKMSVLQGLRQSRRLARSSVVGSLTGLFVGVPLYWLFGNNGIVPAMVAMSLAVYISYTIEVHQSVRVVPARFDWQKHRPLIVKLVSMGLILVSVTVISNATGYLINWAIRHWGNLSHVGLWQAANSMTNQYSSVVFAALAMDYLPRLAAVAHDNAEMQQAANKQTRILSVLLAPIAGLFIVFAPLIVQILLTSEFMPIITLLRWAAASLIIQAFMFPLGYYTFAKDNKTVFFVLEGLFCNGLMLVLCVAGYLWLGIDGLGYAMVANNIITYAVYYIVNRRLYGYRADRRTVQLIVYATAAGAAFIAASYIPNVLVSYIVMGVLTAASVVAALGTIRRILRRKDAE